MIKYEEIKSVHLELTTKCNASCPLCPRNLKGMPFNAGYPDCELSLVDIKKIFKHDFILQLNQILINGNFGDFMLAKDSLEIVEYFKFFNPKLKIQVNTNGSARTIEYWTKLGKMGIYIDFALDGLLDTHSIYRRDTNFDLVLKNATAFINAGGKARWKMIKFDHNSHQIDECRRLSKKLGFFDFELVDHGRDTAVVYDRRGEIAQLIGNPTDIVDSKTHLENRTRSFISNSTEHYKNTQISPITCYTKIKKEIYISANGDVSPCCFLGFYPKTYSAAHCHGNEQIKKLLDNVANNAKEHPIEKCIEWFNQIEESWQKESFEQGRLYICNQQCGSNIKNWKKPKTSSSQQIN